jgi:hypothetical protein
MVFYSQHNWPKPRYRDLTICVYLSRHLLAVVPVFILSNGPALPSSELIQDRRPTALVGILIRVHEERGNLVPAPLSLDPLQVEGLSDGLTGNG